MRSTRKTTKKVRHAGGHFEWLWANPPAPWNPDFNPNSDRIRNEVRLRVAKDELSEPDMGRERRAELWARHYNAVSGEMSKGAQMRSTRGAVE